MFDVAHVVDDLERRHGRRHGQDAGIELDEKSW